MLLPKTPINRNELLLAAAASGKPDILYFVWDLPEPEEVKLRFQPTEFLWKEALEQGYTHLVRKLLKVNPVPDLNSALLTAISRGHGYIVKLLLADPRVDPAFQENEPLRCAVKNRQEAIVKLLLRDKRVGPLHQVCPELLQD